MKVRVLMVKTIKKYISKNNNNKSKKDCLKKNINDINGNIIRNSSENNKNIE